MAECSAVKDVLPEVVRGAAVSPDVERHAVTCGECAAALAGARALGAGLGSWSPPAAPEALVARTLARVRIAEALTPRESQRLTVLGGGAPPPGTIAPGGVVPGGVLPGGVAPGGVAPGGVAPVALDRAHARRSSVELLALWALPGPRPVEAPRGKLGLRLAIQAAAAVILFAVCTGFTVTFYPVVVEALEESRVHSCQERLARVGQALVRYRREHPDAAQDPKGVYALRDALVRGGYAREQDFVCPAARAGTLSFFLKLPETPDDARGVLGWDHLGNHATGINVVSGNGHVEHIEAERLGERLGGR